MRCTMGPDQWAELLEAYERGATARDLSRRFGVSASAIYNRAKAEGREKKYRPRPVVETYVPPPIEGGVRLGADAQEGVDLIADVYAGEIHEPGYLARMAISASGQALRSYAYDEARTLARLAEHYTRLADCGKQTNLHTVMRAIFDREFAGQLFQREEGERNLVKDIYWARMADIDEELAQNEATANASSSASKPADAC